MAGSEGWGRKREKRQQRTLEEGKGELEGGREERKKEREGEGEGVKLALILPSFQTFTAFNGAVSNRREKEGNK